MGKEYGMNRLIRGILYITAGCLGIGCAALILGLALGGGRAALDGDVMFGEAKSVVRDVIAGMHKRLRWHSNIREDAVYSYEDEGGYAYEYGDGDAQGEETTYAGDLAWLREGGNGIYANESSDGVPVLLETEASGIQNLGVSLQKGNLEIVESDDGMARVFVSGPSDGITADCQSGELAIRDGRSGRHGREEVSVVLELPKGMRFKEARLEGNAGAIQADYSLAADLFSLAADVGEITLSGIQAKTFSASVGAGMISIEDGVFDTVELDCGVGAMEIEAAISADAQISCGMGSVSLELEDGGIDKANYVLSCGAGTIMIGDRAYSGLSKERRIENGASATFTLHCGMGQISIE